MRSHEISRARHLFKAADSAEIVAAIAAAAAIAVVPATRGKPRRKDRAKAPGPDFFSTILHFNFRTLGALQGGACWSFGMRRSSLLARRAPTQPILSWNRSNAESPLQEEHSPPPVSPTPSLTPCGEQPTYDCTEQYEVNPASMGGDSCAADYSAWPQPSQERVAAAQMLLGACAATATAKQQRRTPPPPPPPPFASMEIVAAAYGDGAAPDSIEKMETTGQDESEDARQDVQQRGMREGRTAAACEARAVHGRTCEAAAPAAKRRGLRQRSEAAGLANGTAAEAIGPRFFEKDGYVNEEEREGEEVRAGDGRGRIGSEGKGRRGREREAIGEERGIGEAIGTRGRNASRNASSKANIAKQGGKKGRKSGQVGQKGKGGSMGGIKDGSVGGLKGGDEMEGLGGGLVEESGGDVADESVAVAFDSG
eukprot:6192253-Pleurochrysis_carterae.AAC.1